MSSSAKAKKVSGATVAPADGGGRNELSNMLRRQSTQDGGIGGKRRNTVTERSFALARTVAEKKKPIAKMGRRATALDIAEAKKEREELIKKKKERAAWKIMGCRILDHWSFQLTAFVFTVVALVGDDIVTLALPPAVDEPFFIILVVILIYFILEVLANSLLRLDYLLSMFFWFDILGAVSLIPDIPWLSKGFILALGGETGDDDTLTLARAGRAARGISLLASMGFALICITLVDRNALLGDYEIATCQWPTHATTPLGWNKVCQDDPDDHNDGDDIEKSIEERPSKIGQKLAELVSRRVVLLIMGIILFTPLLADDQVDFTRFSFVAGLDRVNSSHVLNITASFIEEQDTDLIYLRSKGILYVDKVHPLHASLRPTEIATYGEGCTDLTICPVIVKTTVAKYVTRRIHVEQSIYNLSLTLFVVAVLVYTSYSFNHDAQVIIVRPVEKMTHVVRKVMTTLMSLRSEVDHKNDSKKEEEETFETDFLESSITKMADLLKIGFGTAGTEIIAHNFSSGGDLNPMVPGKKVRAIFGFCYIGGFEQAMNHLREDIMVFVNSIAKVVHKYVELSNGSPNKNLGEAFLMVWKLPPVEDESIEADNREEYLQWVKDEDQQVADSALDCVARVMNELRIVALDIPCEDNSQAGKDLNFLKACCERIPDFKLHIGFGLHTGWAIEGAIGSHDKIDASYLSPHVNLSARLETATKQYGVGILISENVFHMLSDGRKARCRKLDRVTVKGSKQPIAIYSNDLNMSTDSMWHEEQQEAVGWGDKEHEKHRSASNGSLADSVRRVSKLFARRLSIGSQKTTVGQYRRKFTSIVDLYIAGSWAVAIIGLRQLLEERPRDKAAQVLFDFIQAHDCKPPPEWNGYRPLNRK